MIDSGLCCLFRAPVASDWNLLLVKLVASSGRQQLHVTRQVGNGPFKAFMKSYPAEGGYTEGMEMNPKYHCWAASQYREKV